MKLIFLIIILFTIGCKSIVTDNDIFSLGEEFILNFNQEKKLINDNLTVKFDSVLTDSRCALGTVCVWEGEAQIRLKLHFKDNDETEYRYLKIKGYVNKENSSQHQSVFARYYVITLLQLDPYPVHNVPINFEKYKALLKIQTIKRK